MYMGMHKYKKVTSIFIFLIHVLQASLFSGSLFSIIKFSLPYVPQSIFICIASLNILRLYMWVESVIYFVYQMYLLQMLEQYIFHGMFALYRVLIFVDWK